MKRFHVASTILLTLDFAESQVKKRVKKGGSLPSMMIYIGASRDNFSIRKSRSINFCQNKEFAKKKKTVILGKVRDRTSSEQISQTEVRTSLCRKLKKMLRKR